MAAVERSRIRSVVKVRWSECFGERKCVTLENVFGVD